MNWFPDMFWLFLEWWLWPLLGALLGLALGWFVWRRGWRRSETALNGQMQSLQSEHQGLDNELTRLRLDAGRRNDENEAVKAELVTLQSDLSARTEQTTSLEVELEELRASSALSLDLDLKASRDEVDSLQVERDAALEKLAQHEVELQSVIDLRTDLEKGLAAKESEVVSLRTEHQSSLQSLQGVNQELGDLRQRSSVLEVDVDGARQRVTELEATVIERDGRVTELEGLLGERDGQLAEYSMRVAELESSVAASQSEAVELRGFVGERDARLSDAEGQLAELASLRSVVAERDVRVAELESSVAASQSEAVELRGFVGQRDDRVEELEGLLRDQQRRSSELEQAEVDRSNAIADVEPAAAEPAAVEPVDAFEEQLQTLASGRSIDYVDDLEEINGVGPVMNDMLQSQGLRTFYQLALLDDAGVGALESRIDSFPGRIVRDEWVPQAAALHLAHHGEDLGSRVVIQRSEARSALAETGNADFFSASLARSKAERPNASPDDLMSVKGIGNGMNEALNKNGLTTLYELATLDAAAIDDFETRANLQPGRVRQENWVPQAAQLHFEVHGEEIYDLVTVEGQYSDAFESQMAQMSQGRRFDYVDGLQMISGVGPKMEALLKENGLKTFLQVSLLDRDGVTALNDRLDFFPGRIERDEWVSQAAGLHAEHHPEMQ